jgi:hypothetical protein
MLINHVCNINNWTKPQEIKGLKTLILGSFNPFNPNGNNADYYYGRSSNYLWKVIATLMQKNEDYFNANFENKLEVMNYYKFCFLDAILTIEVISGSNNDVQVNQFIDEHILTDFTDSKLFTTKHKESGVIVKRTYNSEIFETIKQSNIKKIIHTMGNNTLNLNFISNPKEKGLGARGFQGYINEIRSTGVNFVPISYSPSRYAVNSGGKDYLPKLTNWIKENLEIN